MAKRDERDFPPTASLETLQLRAALLRAVRSFFDGRGYLEVETPLLSRDVCVDRHLEPFVTRYAPDGKPGGAPLFLQTSPEFHMKRLLAAGAKAIYQVTHSFRNGECGRRHNPEFALVEWYKVGDTDHDQMNVVEALVREVFAAAGAGEDASWAASPFPRLTYREAFARYVGIDPLAADLAELRRVAEHHAVNPPPFAAEDRDRWLNFLLATHIEPHLGRETPVFLHDYPASQAALARVRAEEFPVAERFELYMRGIEICNGYHELLDADELRRRNREANARRVADGRQALPEDSRLLDAMDAGLPACSGVALGFDRLVMLALGKSSLAEVMAFPFDRA